MSAEARALAEAARYFAKTAIATAQRWDGDLAEWLADASALFTECATALDREPSDAAVAEEFADLITNGMLVDLVRAVNAARKRARGTR